MPSAAHIDLHCHSVYSDGTFTPETLVEQAARAGLGAFAITDHDTIQGLDRAAAAASRLGVDLISGVEISADCEGTAVHILGYLFDPTHAPLASALKGVAEVRKTRVKRMVERLRALGVSITVEDVLAERAEGTWGRPHVARALLRRRQVKTFDEAFRRFLGNDRPAYVPRTEVSAGEAIELIHRAGGVAVLAHPLAYRCGDQGRRQSLTSLLDSLVSARMDGMEVAYSNCSAHDSNLLMSEARVRGLAFSGGSDYHGTATPQVSLGSGRGNLRVPAAWLQELEARRCKAPGAWIRST